MTCLNIIYGAVPQRTERNIKYNGNKSSISKAGVESKSIYQGNKNSVRPTKKKYCLFDKGLFEVPHHNMGWYPKVMYAFYEQLEAVLSYTACAMVIRFDLHVTGYSHTNKIMTTFWRRLSKKLNRKYKEIAKAYVWVREQEKAKQQHYHVALIVDKNIIHYSGAVTSAVIEVWKGLTGLQAHIPKNCYYTVKDGRWCGFEDALKRVSYLAKERGKGYRPKQTKDFNSSRLKLKT